MLGFLRLTSRQESSDEEEEAEVCDERAQPNAIKSKKVFMERRSLPENFSDEVMELEFEIEENKFGVETVDRLVYLYSQAMEYYEGYDNDKFIRFKDRISRLLMRP